MNENDDNNENEKKIHFENEWKFRQFFHFRFQIINFDVYDIHFVFDVDDVFFHHRDFFRQFHDIRNLNVGLLNENENEQINNLRFAIERLAIERINKNDRKKIDRNNNNWRISAQNWIENAKKTRPKWFDKKKTHDQTFFVVFFCDSINFVF